MKTFTNKEEILHYINQELKDSGRHGAIPMEEALIEFDIDEEDLTCEMIDRRIRRFLTEESGDYTEGLYEVMRSHRYQPLKIVR